MHGGALGSGAPLGNQNALRHGTYSKATQRQFAELNKLVKECLELLENFEATGK